MSSWQQRVLAATAAIHVGSAAHPAGTGVLIEADKVLTCRHVVAGGRADGPIKPGITVRLPGLAPIGGVWPEQGEWLGVDAVVLTLPEPVKVAPVVLSGSLRAPLKVELVGYPQEDLTEEGVWRTFTVHAATRTLVQLDWTDVGSFIGHSGGPVLDADSGKLVGILREGSAEGRFDRYLPLLRLVEGGVLARLPWLIDGDDAEGHFARRSQGRRGTAGRDIFTGRQAALARLTGWLTSPEHTGRVLVVTGQPGAGKSAVTARAGLQVASELGRDPNRRGLVFHARAANAAAFRRAVADLFGSGADETPYALLEDIDRIGAEAPGRRWLLVVDALDEAPRAADREQIATLVEQLARRPWVRAVVATRPLSAQGATEEANLLQRLGIHSPADGHLLNLDNDTYFDNIDVEGLAGQLLTQADQAFPIPGTAAETYRADPLLRKRLARVIAETARRNFLVAGITASQLADTRTVVDPAASGFDITALPTSVGGALDQFLDSREDGAQLRGILTALAYAEGTGMDDRTWLTITGALGYPATQADLDSLQTTTIADYLLQSGTEADGRVIRLFHQALADQLRRHRDARGDQDAITAALIDEGRSRGWANTARYTLRHLAAHADAAGRIGQLLPDLDFLLHADLADVRRILSAPQSGQPTEVAAVLLSAGGLADELAPDQRAEFLALHAAHLGLPGLMHGFNARTTAAWQPLWAHSLGSHRTTLEGHTSSVRAVAAVPLPDGRVLLASGGGATVRLWDPVTGTPAGNPLEGHTGPVRAVAAVPLPDGRVLLASGGDDRTVRLWDPVTGTPAGNPLQSHTGPVRAVAAVPLPDGRVLLASGGGDATVRLWDPVTGTPAGSPLEGHTDGVNAVAAVPLPDGRVLLASGGDDETVRLWDPVTGTSAGNPLEGHTDWVNAVAAVPLPDGRVLLASGGDDETVRLWDPVTGTPAGSPLQSHTGPVRAVAAVPLPDGRVLLASGGADETVQLSDPVTGTPAGSPLQSHTGTVRAVAAVPLPDGRVLLASGGDDRTVRLWDPVTGTPAGNPLQSHTGTVRAVAAVPLPDGRVLLASGGDDRTVRLWDLVTGTPAGNPLEGHTDGVNAVAAVPLPDGQVLLASASSDRTVRLWDPAAGTPAGNPLEGHTGPVNAVAAMPLPDGQVLLASGGADETVRLWDPAAGTPAGSPLEGHTGPVNAVAAVPLPDGQVLLASASSDRTVRLWDPAAGTPAGNPLEGHSGPVRAVAAVPLPDGRVLLASGGDDRTVRLWDPAAGSPVGGPLEGHTGPVNAVAAVPLPDGQVQLASASSDRTVRLWDPATRTPVAVIHLAGPAHSLTATNSQTVAGAGRSLAAFVHRPADA